MFRDKYDLFPYSSASVGRIYSQENCMKNRSPSSSKVETVKNKPFVGLAPERIRHAPAGSQTKIVNSKQEIQKRRLKYLATYVSIRTLCSKKRYFFQRIVLSAGSIFTAPNDVLKKLFWSFLQQMKAKNLSSNRHA